MVETLLTPSSIMLYGRLMIDLQLDPNFTLKEGTSRNEFLWHQLKLEPKKTQPKLARIYGFSYEGLGKCFLKLERFLRVDMT